MDCITPSAVESGDEVAVLAPSSQRPNFIVERGVNRLRDTFDVSPMCYPSALGESLTPADKAEEVHEAFESDATAVFAVVGGDEQMRILRYLDLERLRANPTRFFGISDNTNLHLALSAAGLVSYYGGQFIPGIALDSTLPEYTERNLRRALFNETLGEVVSSETWTDDYYDFGNDTAREWETNSGWTWDFPSDGVVTGPVWGGCLSVLGHFLAANRFVPDSTDDTFVLALETSELTPGSYTMKSVLTSLGERGLLERAAAVIVGRPKTRHKELKTDEEREQYRQEQRGIIRETCRVYHPDVPILFDLDFGHTDPHIPIPIGGEVRLDSENRSVVFDHF